MAEDNRPPAAATAEDVAAFLFDGKLLAAEVQTYIGKEGEEPPAVTIGAIGDEVEIVTLEALGCF